jgi:hypothetical protein
MTAVNAILFFRVMLSFDKVNRLLAHIFKPIPFKGIAIEISALILGKVTCAMSRAVTTRIVHNLKGRSAIPVYYFDNLGPNLFINSRTPTIASGNKIAAMPLVVAGLTISIICRPPYLSLRFQM